MSQSQPSPAKTGRQIGRTKAYEARVARRHQEQANEACSRVLCAHSDRKPDDPDEKRADSVVESFSGLVRVARDDEGHNGGEGEGGSA